MNNMNLNTHPNLKNFKELILIKNNKTLKIMNSFWFISIIFNILSILVLFFFYKYYITINLLYLGKELATTSIITLSFSFICALMFENYFLKQ